MRRRADGAEASLLFGPGNRRKGSPPALRSCRADDRFRRMPVPVGAGERPFTEPTADRRGPQRKTGS